jgi:crotonobetainyl-CoA:carnitine CoA-transferase CaiB-like acyl-CoA transferase
MRQPLEGIRIVELGMFHAGPGGSAILGDLGAEVIKIEEPGVGDPIRRQKRVGSCHFGLQGGGTVWNEAANRNKKSITIDLRKGKGCELAYRLVSKSDVFLTSLRRQAIEKMKMTYSDLRHINPKLIYASVSGYGPRGPHRDVGAFDYQGQGRSGMMFSVGEPEMPPLVSQFAIVDQTTSIMASQAIITALFFRERTGIGQEVNVSILGTALYMQYANILLNLLTGVEVPRHRRSTEAPLRNYYKCADDRWIIMTLPPFERYWPPLCKALEHPELEKDVRFDTEAKRFEHSEQLVALLDQIFAARPRDEWLNILEKYDLNASPVHHFSELKDDPQILENDYIVDFEHPRLGKIKIPGYPVQFSDSWAKTRTAAPDLGEHTTAVLTEICGYSQREIAELKAEGII